MREVQPVSYTNHVAEQVMTEETIFPNSEETGADDAYEPAEIVEISLELAESLKKSGNEAFVTGEYSVAVTKYKSGLASCPPEESLCRSLLLSNLAAALIKQEKWSDAAEAATSAIEAGVPNDKALERRAFAYSNISEKYEQAVEDYEELMKKCPNRTELAAKVRALKKKIEERNEKLKKDMMDNLKKLGNMCLNPFGLSTDSFQLQPNGEGGYSIAMKNSNTTPAGGDSTN